MNAIISTSISDASAMIRADKWLSFMRPGERDWLRALSKVDGPFFKWTESQKAALLEDAMTATGDAETYIAEACVFGADEAKKILAHIASGNDQALGRLIREKIMAEYDELLTDIVDRA